MTNGLCVLVVDDEESNRQGVLALLEFAPDIQRIHEAADGLEALEIVAEVQPDVVLMDVRMPVMDGLEATRQIKERWPYIIVVVLTMYAHHREEALTAGADRFLLKGDRGQSLTEVVRFLASHRDDNKP